MNIKLLRKLELYSQFLGHPIIVVKDLFEKGDLSFFLAIDYTEFNPSNHIYTTNLRRCKCLNEVIEDSRVLDVDSVKTKVEYEINETSLELSNDSSWFKIS